ncbi:hypothetical protein SMD22_01640 (plasmid) [Brevibacillus halotolerans]|nr:hypothetical protein SMD22_01640 [Brevibacillus halotolerans]
MKMSNKKFVAMATTLGLSVGLLTGCGANPDTMYDDNDKDKDKKRGTSSGGAFIGSMGAKNSSSSDGVASGSKGIGSIKGGGAGS